MLRNLTIIDEAQKDIRKRYGITIPLWTEEILNDRDSLEMIGRGDTNGVFQLESDGMKSFMQQLKPSCFEDIIAGVSLYRPGPMDFIPDYIKGKKDPSSITYQVPQLEPILAPTYGCIVYQEQVMQIVRSLAGFSLGRADLVRKGMSKKKQEIMDEEMPHFINGDESLGIKGCTGNGISSEDATKIWASMVDFAKYAFNKSHAAAYAAISMQTAYLKCHYPAEFAAGLLTSVMDKTEKLTVYVNEFRKKGYTIETPDINTSMDSFTVTDESHISYGLASIKDVGSDAIKSAIKEREQNGPYKGLYDFMERNIKDCNRKMAEALVHAGAFDFTGYSRKASAMAIETISSSIRDGMKKNIQGQISLFDYAQDTGMEFGSQESCIRDCPEYSPFELISLEKEVTGSYLSRHPLDSFKAYLEYFHTLPSVKIWDIQDISRNAFYCFAGIIMRKKVVYTKSKGEPMAFLTLDDKEGSLNAVVFPHAYELFRDILEENKPVLIYGNVTEKDGERSVSASRIIDLTDRPCDIRIDFTSPDDLARHAQELNTFLRSMPPAGEVYALVRIYVGGMRYQCFETTITKELTERAASLLGQDRAKAMLSRVIAPKQVWR